MVAAVTCITGWSRVLYSCLDHLLTLQYYINFVSSCPVMMSFSFSIELEKKLLLSYVYLNKSSLSVFYIIKYGRISVVKKI